MEACHFQRSLPGKDFRSSGGQIAIASLGRGILGPNEEIERQFVSHGSVETPPAHRPLLPLIRWLESLPRIAVAIMAAGKGTRLKSQLPKVLHEVGGKPLLEHVIRAAVRIVPAKDVYAIIGHEADRVRAAMKHTGVNFVLQAEQRGTGHALMVAREALAGYDHVIVLSGDAPLITAETIARLRDVPSGRERQP